jgi:pimeloyl-ACP methyl ester carboxylesterase
MWPVWDHIKIPVLTIRGASSDLLTEETFARMIEAGSESLIIANAGHAPALMDAPAIAAIQDFLTA